MFIGFGLTKAKEESQKAHAGSIEPEIGEPTVTTYGSERLQSLRTVRLKALNMSTRQQGRHESNGVELPRN